MGIVLISLVGNKDTAETFIISFRSFQEYLAHATVTSKQR